MSFTVIFLLVCATVGMVEPHGYLKDPPARGTMWRQGWDTPENYNDNQLFCGGKQHQHLTNGGKCGVCGDPYEMPQPRDNEGGGKYSSGVISKCYKKTSSFIEVKVQLTANHLGYFEFRLCEHNDPFTPVTQECLDEHVLTLHNGGGTRYYVAPENGEYTVELLLPEDIQCNQCVLQWKYNTGNSWGCEGELCGLGYGDQEQFYGCSDISVLESCENFDHYQYLNKPSTSSTTTTPTPSTTTKSTPSVTTTPTPSTTTKSTPSVTTTPTPSTTRKSTPSVTTTSTPSTTTKSTNELTSTTKSSTTKTTTRLTPTSTASTLTTASSAYGECYPKPEFEVEKDAFDEICKLGCSKGLCLSYYCECKKQQSTTKSSTLMTIISSSVIPSSSSSSSSPSLSSTSTTKSTTTTLSPTTTQSSQKCQYVKVTDLYQGVAGMLDWCVQQCLINICPSSHCIC
ncbi:uncharacterized protein LOC133202437 [Saccostrea echinata]|uniref:uncharacterized protein LOC133202437 n=1 Tax=Saccostrea echinata TaxID=191078 RepID=UPI002A8016BA|nr:uncharacterized protein LOC133202437 [Saccostrea echinata]